MRILAVIPETFWGGYNWLRRWLSGGRRLRLTYFATGLISVYRYPNRFPHLMKVEMMLLPTSY